MTTYSAITTHSAQRAAAAARAGMSLMELMAVLGIVSVIAAAAVMRFASPRDNANAAACDAHIGDIEMQTQLWRRDRGAFPAADLSDIEAFAEYFPEGLPTCPVDPSAPYTIDPTTGRVVGHAH